MSNSGGAGGRGGRGGGGGGGAGSVIGRVTIPETVRKTILSIREITGKQHTDEDIYSVLKDCSMDPNETAQKLLYIDTFHEVKSKRDRRKEMSGTQGRGARSGRGNHSANHIYSDTMGRRNAASRRENGVNQMKEKGPSTPLPVVQKINTDSATNETKASAIIPNGSLNLPNGSSHGCGPQLLTDGDVSVAMDGLVVDAKKPGEVPLLPSGTSSPPNQMSESVVQVQQGKSAPSLNHLPPPAISASVSGVYSSASDPVLASSTIRHPGAVGAIKREVDSQLRAAGHNHIQGNKHVLSDVDSETSENEKAASNILHPVSQKEALSKPKSAEEDELSKILHPSSLSTDDHSLAFRSSSGDTHSSQESVTPLTAVVSSEDAQAEDSSPSSPEQTVPNGHVIFPNHFKVPEALKSGLSFGSFDTNSGLGSSNNGNACDINSADAVDLPHRIDETAKEPSLSNQSISSTVQVDHPDQPESSQQTFDKLKSDGNAATTLDSKSDNSTQEMMMLPEGNQNPAFHIAPNYGFGIMPHMHGGHFVQFEKHETQSENPTASSSPSPSLSPTPAQNSIAASPQPLLYRPPFPPNYFPYGHYFNPYFLPPMHQFLTHNGLPQQPATGNPYLTPAAPVPGVKFPLPQFKPGTSTGNSTPIGIQTLYGSFGSSPNGFNPGPAVTSGSAASNEDLSASQLKESQIYTTGPLNDISAWISPPGQDVSSLHLNTLYHLNPHGQHLAFPHAQPGPSPFPGIYPQMQTIAAPSTVNPILHQSQALSATAETVGPASGAYQQPQLAQLNWNSSY
ncbi:GBF-interacting protein 1 isoform X1 [Ricinus communis]|uniref:GBF-interacting protein 1 isoform X1 n=1 Tax=Ricinus communis TaxID=3988 RepID=UPI000772CE0B|nr:GBF-interacting protein 1 isoform X1 [Ricinus communis]|eukprot:XP_015577034.1 GBF-interacting protein 1 isoform X1 [Ricinus communis]